MIPSSEEMKADRFERYARKRKSYFFLRVSSQNAKAFGRIKEFEF
jgi:hypothetical protein